MNGKKAKQIKKKIYGDFSHKERSYKKINGTIINTGKRAAYLNAKRRGRLIQPL